MRIFEKIDLQLYGASHQKYIGFKLYNIDEGYEIDNTKIDELLNKRKGSIRYNTSRNKLENYTFKSGIKKGLTTGEIIHVEIEQNDFQSKDYEKGIVRTSHADITGYLKFGDEYDYKGGGEFSGKMTVLYVIAGEIARQVLQQKEFNVESYFHISKVLNYSDDVSMFKTKDDFGSLEEYHLPIFNDDIRKEVEIILEELKQKKDSVGAKLTFQVFNVPCGLGDIFLNSFESKLSALIFSVPAVKAIEFGVGNEFSEKYGSEVVEIYRAVNGNVESTTNFNGGINGGITNGFQPLRFSCTIKPAATLVDRKVSTVKYVNGSFEDIIFTSRGRHDNFIANRAAYPIIAFIYLAILDYVN